MFHNIQTYAKTDLSGFYNPPRFSSTVIKNRKDLSNIRFIFYRKSFHTTSISRTGYEAHLTYFNEEVPKNVSVRRFKLIIEVL